ncbi:MAG: hypothetical protein GY940_24235 [bacterium]|nr:hypothetical protein [bacterium]
MNYSINIFDTENLNAATVFEFAKRNSLKLRYSGGLDKMLNIIGSDIQFQMEVTDFQDAFFAHLYTYDERRYWVTWNNADTGAILWQGHLLPEQYSEPYTSGAFFVKFTASCGLGGLKTQYLPDQYYEGERTVIEIIAQCLRLTGINANINVAPAITNINGAHWGEIYIDAAAKFIVKNVKQSAYKILLMLLSPLHTIFQDHGQWYIYGYNKRVLLTVNYDVFDNAGAFIENQTIAKSVLNKTFQGVPIIGVNSPRREITASHAIKDSQISKEVYKIKNPGYAVAVPTELVNHNWTFSNTNFQARYSSIDGVVYLNGNVVAYDPTKNVTLRNELLILEGEKIQWNFELKSAYSGTETYLNTVETMVVNGWWDKILLYDIYYTDPVTDNEVILYSNINGPAADDLRYQLKFGVDRVAEMSIQTVAPATAYYNIRFYQPQTSGNDIKTDTIDIKKLELLISGAEDQKIYENNIPELYTQGIGVDLGLHDDLKDYDNIFRFEKLGATGDIYDVEIRNNFQVIEIDGRHFFNVNINDAITLDNHRDNVFVNGDQVRIIDVHYNWPGNFDFSVEYDAELLGRVIVTTAEDMQIDLRKMASLPVNIGDWVKWADDIYKTNYTRYGTAVVEILRALYLTPHPRISAICKDFVFFRDLINFNYDGDKVFYLTNLQIQMDANNSVMEMSQNMYSEAVTAPTGNIPPSVNAGVDISLNVGIESAALAATATDPDGTIDLIEWVVLSGDGNPVIVSPNSLNTDVNGLTGDHYVLQITVTDNVGLTATDTITITSQKNYQLVATEVFFNDSDPTGNNTWEQTVVQWIDFTINPPLVEGQTARMTIDAIIELLTPQFIAGAKPSAVWSISKHNVSNGITTASSIQAQFTAGIHQATFLVFPGDTIHMRVTAKAFNSAKEGIYPEWAGLVHATVQSDVTIVAESGPFGIFTNVPQQFTIEAQK